MGLKVTNNAFGTLNASINSSATTIVLVAGQGARFPTLSAGDYFYATLIDTSNNLEIVKVTARSTDTLTVVRGQDNTTGRAYATNDRFELRPTAVMLNEIITAAEAALPLAGGTMTGTLTIQKNGTQLRLVGTGAGYAEGHILLENPSNGYRGQGVYMYDSVSQKDWYAGTPYTANDQYIIARRTGEASFDGGAAQTGNSLFTIDAAGRVTKPFHTAFCAQSSGGYQTTSPVPFTSAKVNTGSHFNTSTYRFTAPIAGRYVFTLHMYFDNNTSNDGYPRFRVNGSTNHGYCYMQGNGDGDKTSSITTMIQMAASDYIEIIYTGTLNYYGGAEETQFTGYLLG